MDSINAVESIANRVAHLDSLAPEKVSQSDVSVHAAKDEETDSAAIELFEPFAAQWLVVQFQLLKQEIDRIQSQTESRIKELQHDEE